MAQSFIGYVLPLWGPSMGITPQLTVAMGSISGGQISREGCSCGLLATSVPRSWGMVTPLGKGGLGNMLEGPTTGN